MREGEYLDSLIQEYETVFAAKSFSKTDGRYLESEVLDKLSGSADWSPSAASFYLLTLIRDSTSDV